MIWVSAVEEPLLLLATVDPVRSLCVRRVWGNERRFRLLPEEKRKSKKGRMIIRLVDKKKRDDDDTVVRKGCVYTTTGRSMAITEVEAEIPRFVMSPPRTTKSSVRP